MSWSTPRTWIVGEVVTAAELNQYLRDELAYLHGDAGAITFQPTSTIANLLTGGDLAQLKVAPATMPVPGVVGLVGARYSGVDVAAVLAQITATGSVLAFGVSSNYASGITSAPLQVVYDGRVLVNGMMAHRHPYGSNRHIEAGTASTSGGAVAVTFTSAFSSTPNISTSVQGSAGVSSYFSAYENPNATGVTLLSVSGATGNAGGSVNVGWHAEGLG